MAHEYKNSRLLLFLTIIIVTPSLVLAQDNETDNETTSSRGGLADYVKQSPYEFPEETGFAHPIGSKKVTTGTTLETGTLTEEDASWLLEGGSKLNLNIKGKEYTLKAITVTKENFIFEINKEREEISKGEELKLNLEDNKEYDLKITFHKQFPPTGRFADITLTVISEAIEEEIVEDVPEVIEEVVQKPTTNAINHQILAGIVGIVIGGLIIFAISLFRRK